MFLFNYTFGVVILLVSLIMAFVNPKQRTYVFGYRSFFLYGKNKQKVWEFTNRVCGLFYLSGSVVYLFILFFQKKIDLEIINEKKLFIAFILYLFIIFALIELTVAIKKMNEPN